MLCIGSVCVGENGEPIVWYYAACVLGCCACVCVCVYVCAYGQVTHVMYIVHTTHITYPVFVFLHIEQCIRVL